MSESPVYRPHPEDPPEARLRTEVASGAWAGLQAERFEIVSRGDFVSGILYRSERFDEASGVGDPLLLIQHGAADASDADDLACAAPWARKGLAVASIDLALHGRRASPKLSQRLVESIRDLAMGLEINPESAVLLEEFARQTTSDLIRTLDALAGVAGIDSSRIGFLGFGLGAIAGTYLLAHDPRTRAAVLVHVGGGRGPAELDPVTYLENAARAQTTTTSTSTSTSTSRSILIVAAEDDERVSATDVDALFKAAPEPKELLRHSGNSQMLPKETLTAIEDFIRRELKF